MDKLSILMAFVELFVIVMGKNIPHGNTDSLVHVGTANGSSFFADKEQRRNWTEAQKFCNATGMHLASINTAEQVEMLRGSPVTGTGPYGFWTAGRDAQTLSQFVWDHNAETPNATILNLVYTYEVSTCLYLFAGEVKSFTCTEALNTLCELNHGH